MTMNMGDLGMHKFRIALSVAVTTLLLVCTHTTSAQALGSGKFAWRGDDSARTVYYFYGSGGTSGTLAYASTNASGMACLLYVKRVRTKISLPNGSYATQSSLLGQCSSTVDIASSGYSVFQIRSTHTLQKWSGAEYNYVL